MQLGPDEKLNLIFAVFDENKSWYFLENMQKSSHSPFNTTDPQFYETNVIYSKFSTDFRLNIYFFIFFFSIPATPQNA